MPTILKRYSSTLDDAEVAEGGRASDQKSLIFVVDTITSLSLAISDKLVYDIPFRV